MGVSDVAAGSASRLNLARNSLSAVEAGDNTLSAS